MNGQYNGRYMADSILTGWQRYKIWLITVFIHRVYRLRRHATGEIMGKISTHVLDITQGKPGAGVAVELYAVEGQGRTLLRSVVTNQDGRCAAPLLEADEMVAGQYELVFAVGDYFASRGVDMPEPRFLDRVIIAFGIADPAQNYHVPLVVSPWAYSTYRGS
jgi:5-hydroxyisourate hydrolase